VVCVIVHVYIYIVDHCSLLFEVAKKVVCVVSGYIAKTGLLGIRIMCPSGMTYLSADCSFSELALKIQLSMLV
jgi:hypothetical protein